jgi:hypothetical protein
MGDQPSKIGGIKIHALVFGLFLGLCIWKFGDPVILDHKIAAPATWSDFLNDAWPTHWANWLWPALAIWGVVLMTQRGVFSGGLKGAGLRRLSIWLWLLPLAWLGWQFISANPTVDPGLTADTLWQYGGCAACYFWGILLFGMCVQPPIKAGNRRETSPSAGQGTRSENRIPTVFAFLLAGILVAFTFCLIRAVDQRLFEYPQNYQELVEGERAGWTNIPPAMVAEMKTEGIIINTNGVEMANPAIVAKFAKGRVCGTLVYPNALAELILVLWPVSLALAFGATKDLRPLVRWAAIAVALFLGGAAFFWTGSKLGWLIGMGLAGVVVLRLNWSKKLKAAAVSAVLVVGLGIFAVRFHHYFAAGATSAGARFDYWRAAAQITAAHPWFGSGPGTFGDLYSKLKSPESEMARLAHNDYLEQFSDSGIPAGLVYTAWIVLALALVGRRLWHSDDRFSFAIYLGLLGWFAQGLGEFGLFVPGLAWTAFTLLGCLIGRFCAASKYDK